MGRTEIEELLLARQGLIEPSARLTAAHEIGPVTPLTYADGHQGWLITGRDVARRVLADPRFSARAELRRHPTGALGDAMGRPAAPGGFGMMDPPEHTRLRRLLTGQFTVHRMRTLTPRIAEYAASLLDRMHDCGPPVDLVRHYAIPIPSLVICDLLGVPYADRAMFGEAITSSLALHASPEELTAAKTRITEYLAELVADKKKQPTDDILGGLIGTGELTDTELVTIAHVLLAGGFETTANMIALGTLVLLRSPDRLAALRADPALLPGAVEELLRYCSIAGLTLTRAATEDVELEGVTVEAGQVVTISVLATNHDPHTYPEPGRFDPGRNTAGHLAFGHGVHQCLGQQLARAELHVAYPALFERFPGLRLAVGEEQLPLRTDMLVYGVHELPVSWARD
ncbi:cytochrome P450 [Sciscionella sediminilitoris]|uniref:cytochrome P450 n=1 Tax=Sciscionella sediminilitoris TaxID=1445613 RepID=UPI0004DF46AB|nr:cytochrome P450 [Sciscionella sp. SE31]